MATTTIRATSICSGNNHIKLEITAGPTQRIVDITAGELLAPVTADELDGWAKINVRLRRDLDNRTNAQLRADLLTGLTVGVSV